MLDRMATYFTPALFTILVLGFFSGLPLALTASTLSLWLSDAKVDKAAIGLFAVVATPYTLKFLWAPLMDSLPVPYLTRLLGRRRSWILVTQLGMVVSLVMLSGIDPAQTPWMTALFAVIVAFMSASQDIVIDAYRVERIDPAQQGQASAMAQLGYRLGMIVSGAGALYCAYYWGWKMTYIIMAAVMALGMLVTYLCKEPDVTVDITTRKPFAIWLNDAVAAPFKDFMQRPQWLMILLFIVLYKFADAFIGTMTNPFLNEIGFDKRDIANIVKVYGTVATLIGVFVGGALVARYGTFRVLLMGGILHGLTNLMFWVQAQVGADLHVLAVGISLENISGGVSSAAFVAYISALCNVRFTATQYALLSSLAAFGRTWLSTPAGYAVKWLGWEWFFALSALLAVPGLLVLWRMEKCQKTNINKNQ